MEKMYKLPWSKNDNPNGWLEITTFCQLSCPGCYRGLDKNPKNRINFSINQLKKEVDFMIKNRNVQTISISGGEPLLYPNLNELVKYIFLHGLKIKIYTNGILLDKSRLIELKKLGVTEFVIHIDKSQRRKGYSSEKDLNKLRENFCKLFREVKKINLGFIMPIYDKNFEEMEDVLNFYKKNYDVINLIVFTCYNDTISPGKEKLKKISLKDIAKKISLVYRCPPSTYLSKSLNANEISWLFFYPLLLKGKTIGNISAKKYSDMQNRYKKKKGKYFITILGNKIKKKSYFYFFDFIKSLKLILTNKTAYNQVILIIDSPEKKGNKWDLCSGCPDATLYNDRLVPSCLLERIKKGEKIFT